jgi:hypothetical protein
LFNTRGDDLLTAELNPQEMHAQYAASPEGKANDSANRKLEWEAVSKYKLNQETVTRNVFADKVTGSASLYLRHVLPCRRFFIRRW